MKSADAVKALVAGALGVKVNMRREQRSASHKTYSMSWKDASGCTHAEQAEGLDISPRGIGIRSPTEVPPGTTVYIQGHDGWPAGFCVVRHCARNGGSFLIGLEQNEETKKTNTAPPADSRDYYAFLQISPNAEPETIHRVYRYLASRFHPDNSETGDPERFLLLKRAFETLTDPERRAAYDASLNSREQQPLPVYEAVDFLDGIEGEVNRRLAVLSILYQKRRVNVDRPHVSLADLEARMGFPREYLDFTTWYLRGKKLITREDNSDFALTALGVDYIEANYPTTPMLRRLLAASAADVNGEPAADSRNHDHGEIFISGDSETAHKPTKH
ncbi:MAG TPA: hypothetical protein DEQ47_03990 [Solibacterales bacterium]|nr:hypothetical protein [Bryobacterales bacterium]